MNHKPFIKSGAFFVIIAFFYSLVHVWGTWDFTCHTPTQALIDLNSILLFITGLVLFVIGKSLEPEKKEIAIDQEQEIKGEDNNKRT